MEIKEMNDVFEQLKYALVFKAKLPSERAISSIQITESENYPVFLTNEAFQDPFYIPKSLDPHPETRILSPAEFVDYFKGQFLQENKDAETADASKIEVDQKFKKMEEDFLNAMRKARDTLKEQMFDKKPVTGFLRLFKDGKIESIDFADELEKTIRETRLLSKNLKILGEESIKKIEKNTLDLGEFMTKSAQVGDQAKNIIRCERLNSGHKNTHRTRGIFSKEEEAFGILRGVGFEGNRSQISQITSFLSHDVLNISYKEEAKFELLYSVQSSGDFKFAEFHRRCGNKGPTVVLCKPKNSDEIIGGFTTKNWKSTEKEEYSEDDQAVLFSFKNRQVFKIKPEQKQYAILNSNESYYGFSFGQNRDLAFYEQGSSHIGYNPKGETYNSFFKLPRNEYYFRDNDSDEDYYDPNDNYGCSPDPMIDYLSVFSVVKVDKRS